MGRTGFVTMLFGLAACGVEESDPLFMSRFVDIPPGFECSYGGVSIETGFDTNNNGVLGDSEVTDARMLCTSATESLTHVSEEPAGINCAAGGARIATGLDANGNGALDDSEITSNQFVCGHIAPQIVRVGGGNEITIDTSASPAATLLTANLIVSAPGKVLAYANGLLYCDAVQCPAADGGQAMLWIKDEATTTVPVIGDGASYVRAPANVGETWSIASSFTVATAGASSYFLRAYKGLGDPRTYSATLTLVFLPDPPSP